MKIWDLVYLEIESWLTCLTRWIPGLIGFAARNVTFRILGMKIEGFAWIQHGVTIVHSRNIRVGKNFGCNTGTYLNGLGGLTIGSHVVLGSNVCISTGRHPIEGIEPPIYLRPTEPSRITIGDDVWLGAGVVVVPGISLATGTVLGANAVATRDSDAYSILVGAPARPVSSRLNI